MLGRGIGTPRWRPISRSATPQRGTLSTVVGISSRISPAMCFTAAGPVEPVWRRGSTIGHPGNPAG